MKAELEDEEREYRMPVLSYTSTEHLSHHLPRMKGCPKCDEGKNLHRYKRRRQKPMAHITGPDAEKKPFGALVNMDWIEVKRNTPA